MTLSRFVHDEFLTERIAMLQEIIPEAFADGQINWKKLQDILTPILEDDDESNESFGLTWPGKRQAYKLAFKRSEGTLIPALGEGINEETTHNLYIEADNLEALKILRKSYQNSIKLIYIDPPYNTGNDFIYFDDYGEPTESYLKRSGQMDESGNLMTTNVKTSGRFHSNWLNMMYPRLIVAKELLCDDGAIFISIDDNELYELKMVMNEIFGESNFVSTIVWQRSKKGDSRLISMTHEYILVYAHNKQMVLDKAPWRLPKEGIDKIFETYNQFVDLYKSNHDQISQAMRKWYRDLPSNDPCKAHKHYHFSDNRGLYFAADFAGPDDGRKSRPRYPILHPITGKGCKLPSTGWRWEEEKTKAALAETPPRIHFGPDESTIPCRKSYLFEVDKEPFMSVFYQDGRSATLQVEQLLGSNIFDFPKNVEVIKKIIQLTTQNDDIVLDFFSGSATTAHAVLSLNQEDNGNRQFIMVQIPEPTKNIQFPTIAEIGKERIRRAIKQLDMSPHPTDPPTLLEEERPQTDLGFRVFKYATSHILSHKPENEITTLAQAAMFFQEDTENQQVIPTNPLHFVYEILLLKGFPLDSQIISQPLTNGEIVWHIKSSMIEHSLFVCLIKMLTPFDIAILKEHSHNGDHWICFEYALNDQLKIELMNHAHIHVETL